MGKTSNASKEKYNAKVYDDIRLRVPKGKKEQIRSFAALNGESLNGFLNRVIDAALDEHPESDAPAREERCKK